MAKKYRPCKCLYCGEDLDRDIEDWVEVGKRYAHSTCAIQEQERKAQEKQKKAEEKLEKLVAKEAASEKDKQIRTKIHSMVKEGCGPAYSAMKINRQIKQYLTEGKTISGILGTIKYYYKVKKGDIAATNGGIAFVEWEYQNAAEYYTKKKKLQNQFSSKDNLIVEKYLKLQRQPPTPCPPVKQNHPKRPRWMADFHLD